MEFAIPDELLSSAYRAYNGKPAWASQRLALVDSNIVINAERTLCICDGPRSGPSVASARRASWRAVWRAPVGRYSLRLLSFWVRMGHGREIDQKVMSSHASKNLPNRIGGNRRIPFRTPNRLVHRSRAVTARQKPFIQRSYRSPQTSDDHVDRTKGWMGLPQRQGRAFARAQRPHDEGDA